VPSIARHDRLQDERSRAAAETFIAFLADEILRGIPNRV
jgi:hypothetical protein